MLLIIKTAQKARDIYDCQVFLGRERRCRDPCDGRDVTVCVTLIKLITCKKR